MRFWAVTSGREAASGAGWWPRFVLGVVDLCLTTQSWFFTLFFGRAKFLFVSSPEVQQQQPMLQRRPNWTELRSMDSYIQILCRFQKCKRKVPPPTLLSTKKLKRIFF